MTNGEKLLKSNMYDILCRINTEMTYPQCVIAMITRKPHKHMWHGDKFDCSRCIEHWLNKEEANWK